MPASVPDRVLNTPYLGLFGASGAPLVVTFGSAPTFSTGWGERRNSSQGRRLARDADSNLAYGRGEAARCSADGGEHRWPPRAVFAGVARVHVSTRTLHR